MVCNKFNGVQIRPLILLMLTCEGEGTKENLMIKNLGRG